MKRESWPVTDKDANDEAPACVYCQVPIGGEHLADCVCRQRTVVVKLAFEVVWRVPEDWEPHDVEFQLNESSLCSDSLVDHLEVIRSHRNANGNCLCGLATGEYLREATPKDEEACHDRIAEPSPSLLEPD